MPWYFIKKQIGGTAMDATNQPKFISIPPYNVFKRKRKLLRFRNINFGGAELKAGLFPFLRKGR